MKRFFISLLSCALLVPANAQQSSSSQESQKNTEDVVRITTNLVQVDATVTDKQGHPITDLQKDDFEVYEDGQLRTITNYSFVSTGSAAATELSKPVQPGENGGVAAPAPTVRLRLEQVRRTVALVVDDLGLSFESMSFVRNALRKFVNEQVQPGDLVAIIRSEDDTHPCANDRFRLTRRIAGANELPATGMVWDLFKNREALTNEMTSLIQSEVQSG